MSFETYSTGVASRIRAAASALSLAAASVLLAGCPETIVTCDGGAGRDADNCLGFRTAFTAPVVDGDLSDESWVRGFRYVLGDGNGTSVPHAVAQGVRTGDAVYLSFEVNNDPTFDVEDAVVLGFDPTGAAANHRRIHIYPVTLAGANADGTPQEVHYWKDSTQGDPDWTDPGLAPAAPTPAWLADNIRVTAENSGSSKHWRVEIRIPVVAGENDPGINLPSDDDFGFYFSVIVAETDGGTEIAAEESWPLATDVGLFIENTPPVASWGNGIFGLRNNGVTIASIGTDQVPDHHIEVDEPNVFRANVENHTTDVDGNPVQAENVRVTFGLLNFGIPGTTPFEPIPTGNNPTPYLDVPAGAPGTRQYQTSPWTVPEDLRDDYLANPNQCLKATLETQGPNTLLVNREARRNTKFVNTASPFAETAVVHTRGAEPAAGQREVEFLLREFRYNTEEEAPWTTELAGAQPIGPRLWRLRAPAGPEAPLETTITPPEITIPVERVAVPPGAPGQPARVAVRPGNLITLVAEGSIVRDGVEIGPNGFDPRAQRAEGPGAAAAEDAGAGEAAERRGKKKKDDDRPGSDDGRFPVPAAESPETRIGALVGSFEGVEDGAFVIGRAATVMVPAGAETLTLGTNDTEEGWSRQEGEGYRVEVIQTPADDIYRYTSSLLPREPPQRVVRLPLGQNLPTWLLCGARRTPRTLTVRDRAFQRYARAGCYSYVVKSIGRDEPVPVESLP